MEAVCFLFKTVWKTGIWYHRSNFKPIKHWQFGIVLFWAFSLSPWNKTLSKLPLTKNVIIPSCSLGSRNRGNRRPPWIALIHNIIQISVAKMWELFICWLLQCCSLYFSQHSWKLYLERLTSSLAIYDSSHLVKMSCWNTCHLLNFSEKKGLDVSHMVIYKCIHWQKIALERIRLRGSSVGSSFCLLNLFFVFLKK